MSKPTIPFTDSHQLYSPVITRIQNRTTSSGESWLDGDVVTPDGIVSVMAQGSHEFMPLTRLDFSCRNRLYMRTWERRYSKRYIATLARRFAREITHRRLA